MNIWKFLWLVLAIIPPGLVAEEMSGPVPTIPRYRIEETIASYRGTGTQDYLAFPAITPSGDNEIMISHKRGKAHVNDLGAVLEILRFDLESGRPLQEPIQLAIPDEVMQMGEWVRFPNGTLGTYIDALTVDEEGKHIRTGLIRSLSRDNGKSFGPLERVGIIDGVEYGYLFDTVTVGQRLYALIMTFEYLVGGRRSVDALYTDDNGETWHFIRNLSQEFGNVRINESSLIPYKDGFLVATRGYDNQQRLHYVNKQFKLIHETNLTEITPTIASYVGRPRLFRIEDKLFLIGRNRRTSEPGIKMELGLMRIDPDSLTVEKQWVLDNIEQGNVTDAYYPFPILVESGDKTLLNVFDYKALHRNAPDIIRFQFDSAEFLK